MAFKEKLQKFMGDEQLPESGDAQSNEFYKEGVEPSISGSNKMILLEPRAFSEAQTIVDYLKSRNTVVVNLKRVTPEIAKRIVDFLSGSVYAISGDLQKLGNGIFLCTPNNVPVEGKISDGDKVKKEEKVEKEKQNRDAGFDW